MVVEGERGGRAIYFSDGRGTAGTVTNPANRTYGHLPMLLHPNPESVLSICFGVGNTLSAIAQHDPKRLVCVELSPGAIEAAPYFPTNRNVLNTPNLEIVIDDGRNYLLRSDELFDVIQLEPPLLHQAAVVNLYTKEFYELARRHLTKNGIVCQWIGSSIPEYEKKMAIRTFLEVFPNSSMWSMVKWVSPILIGSINEIQIDPERFLTHANRPKVLDDLASIGKTPWSLLANHLLGPESLRKYVGDVPLITDDRTYIDFSVPRSNESGFGIFVFNPHYELSQKNLEWRQKTRKILYTRGLRLAVNSESPSYLFDWSMTDDTKRKQIIDELNTAGDIYRRKASKRLARLRKHL